MGIFPSLYLGGSMVIHPFSPNSIGQKIVGQQTTFATGLADGASAVWPAANDALFIPFSLSEPVLVKRLGWTNGATVAGNVDCGIYDTAGVRLLSTGTTAQSGTSAIQSVDVTDTQLGPGLFYMALASDSATATFNRYIASDVMFVKFTGMAKQATAFVLPATATLATVTANYIPTILIFTQGLV